MCARRPRTAGARGLRHKLGVLPNEASLSLSVGPAKRLANHRVVCLFKNARDFFNQAFGRGAWPSLLFLYPPQNL